MKNICIASRIAFYIVVATTFTTFIPQTKATPYASCITNSAGAISFYLNESGGNVTVTYEDGSTNANFNGMTTGTNLLAGQYMFSLTGHTSYSIAIFKVETTGTNAAALVANPSQNTNNYIFVLGNLRGIDVNKHPTSPYFGRIYFDRSNPGLVYNLNADGSFVSSNNAGITWAANSSSPYRMQIAPDDYIMLGDYYSADAGIYRISPNLSSGQLFLGPKGDQVTNSSGVIVHGLEFSEPVIVGTLTNGGTANLYTIDNDFPGSQPNSILIYSNITSAALPWQNPPDAVGPQIGLNIAALSNVYPGLSRGPNGYFYASEQRANYAIPDMYVLDATGTNILWTSFYPHGGTNNDYFVTDSGGGVQGLVDSAVSPDGNYLIGVGIDNHFTICSLTNGIPDASTFRVVAPTSYSQNARGIEWDAADNIYLISSGTAYVQEWTLGFTATAVTTGNASGTTGFYLVYPSTSIGVSAVNSVISQTNSYGNTTNTSFVITRSGDTSGSTTVSFSFNGSATGSSSYPAAYSASSSGSVAFAPGQTSTNITITAVSDGIARPQTTLTITLSSSPTYAVTSPGIASISIINTAPDELVASVLATNMYNAFSNDFTSVQIIRWGDTNAATFTANNFLVSGTAVEGVDYTVPTPVTFNPGDISQTSYIYPLINGQPPVHTNNLIYTGNKTIILNPASGSGYSVATNSVILTIIDSATPPAPILFSDALTNASDATNWNVASANNDMSNHSIDNTITFGYDLQNGDQYGPIPFPPNGAATALRVTVNKSGSGTEAAAGVNLYPTNVSFSGNYAVRFNMNLVEGNNSATTTEGSMFGINHSGIQTNWWTGSTPVSAPPGWASTNWPSDGIWYWISADGGAAAGDYIAYTGNGGTNGNTGWEYLAELYKASFVNTFKTNVFTSSGGPGLAANESPENAPSPSYVSSWSDVEIKQLKNIVTLSIDKTPIYTYTNTTVFTNGTLMLGYDDPFSSVGGADAAVYFSNLRVVQIGPPFITQLVLNKVNNTVVINFTTLDGDASTFSFVLQSASVVKGPYSTVANATITQLGGGAFQIVVPQNGSIQFYRIQQQ